MMSDEWYYLLDGEERGPVPLTQLGELVAAGLLRFTDLVWCKTQVGRSQPAKFVVANVLERIGDQQLVSVVVRGRLLGGGISTGHWPHSCDAHKEAMYWALIAVSRQIASDPEVPKHLFHLAACYFDLGLLCQGAGRLQQAAWACDEAHPLFERLVHSWPEEAEHHKMLAASHNQRGLLNRAFGALEEAEASIEKAVALRRQLLQDDPADTRTAVLLGGALCNLGSVLGDRGRFPEALERYEQALNLLQEQLAKLRRRWSGDCWDWLLRKRSALNALRSTAELYLANTRTGRASVLEQSGR
jgi:tetratricopeptide (TPR) repeat protein